MSNIYTTPLETMTYPKQRPIPHNYYSSLVLFFYSQKLSPIINRSTSFKVLCKNHKLGMILYHTNTSVQITTQLLNCLKERKIFKNIYRDNASASNTVEN